MKRAYANIPCTSYYPSVYLAMHCVGTNKNKANISKNRVDISQNKADISLNRFDISQNKADISKNRVDIRGVQFEWLDVTGMYPKYHRRVQTSSLYPEEQRVCICFLLCSQIL